MNAKDQHVRVQSYARFAGYAAVVALALGLSACGSDNPTGATAGGTGDKSSLSGELAGAGATSQESAEEAWRAGFQTTNPDVSISYDAVGSGGGRTQFLQGAVAFAGTDAALTADEITSSAKTCNGGQALDLPVYISPIAVIYNLPSVKNLNLSPDTLAKIFNRSITQWNDPAIAADNPGAGLPDTAITPVNRSDDSGTTENFTEYLAKTAPTVWTAKPSGTWPIAGGQSAQGTSGVVDTVKGGEGAIGYADASKAGDLGTAKIKVGNSWVGYTADAAAKVADASPRDTSRAAGDIVINIDRTTTAAGAYPLVLVSYLAVCNSYSDTNTGNLVKAYAKYVASADGQQTAAKAAGSAPITDQLRTDVDKAIDSIKVG